MADDYLNNFSIILDKISNDASEQEIAIAIKDLISQEKLTLSPDKAENLQKQLKFLANKTRNSDVTENALNLLISTTHDLSSTLSLADLFSTIVSRARNLVGANIVWLTLLDKEGGIFKTTTAEGHLNPEIAKMTSRVEYGVVNRVMTAKSVFQTQDYLNDQRFVHSPELDQIFGKENIVSLAGFPVIYENNVQGLLFIADRYHRKLSQKEISVLGSFAQHAGVAMRNAQTFTKLSNALEEGENSRAVLVEHIQQVENSAAEHDDMTTLLASGAELRTFVQRMANNIDGAVFLADENMKTNEQYISSQYKGKYALEFKQGKISLSAFASATMQSRQNGRSTKIFESAQEQCLVISLHDGTRHGESLVICYEAPLTSIEIRNLERSAVALSIAKLWNDKRESDKLIATSTLLRHLLFVESPDTSTILSIRNRLSLQAGQSIALMIISVTGKDRKAQTIMVRHAAERLNILVDIIDDSYVALGPKDQLDKMAKNFSKLSAEWKVGGIICDEFTNIAQSPEQYKRLMNALNVLSKMTTMTHFLNQSEINLFAKLFEVGDAKRISEYISDKLAPLDSRASKANARLKNTLLCYFDCQYNIVRTSEKLGVHINTIRQRLDTLRDVTGGWDDPILSLEMHVALRLDAIISND